MPHNESLNDTARIEYLKGYINATLEAIRCCQLNPSKIKSLIIMSSFSKFPDEKNAFFAGMEPMSKATLCGHS